MRVKVPHDSFRLANEQGILNDYLFYIQLKNLTTNGYLKRGNTIPLIRSRYSLSESQIRKKLSNLVKSGFIIKNKGNYWLVSYDKVWSKLGVEFLANGQVKENLFKILPEELNNLTEFITLNEIKLNFKKQYSQAYKNYHCDPFFKNNQDKKNGKNIDKHSFIEEKQKSISIVHLIKKGERDQFCTAYELVKEGEKTNKHCNLDVTVSCLRLAQIMGYNNAMAGFYLEKRLKRLGVIEVENRKIALTALMSQESFEKAKFAPSYSYSNGILYKQLPNKIIVL